MMEKSKRGGAERGESERRKESERGGAEMGGRQEGTRVRRRQEPRASCASAGTQPFILLNVHRHGFGGKAIDQQGSKLAVDKPRQMPGTRAF